MRSDQTPKPFRAAEPEPSRQARELLAILNNIPPLKLPATHGMFEEYQRKKATVIQSALDAARNQALDEAERIADANAGAADMGGEIYIAAKIRDAVRALKTPRRQ